jgi:hypothetical protein
LERYALGELSPEERQRVDVQLALSPDDRACLEQIRSDESELPPLPRVVERARPKRASPLLVASTALAAAAAVALALLRTPAEPPSRRNVFDGVKGGELLLSLHGDRGGEQPTAFAQGERFKVFATCPAWFREPLALLVFQGGQRFAPLGEAQRLQCGNRVPLAGAFALDGRTSAHVCLTWSASAGSAQGPRDLGDEAVCSELLPR